jgi:hypothetical protein
MSIASIGLINTLNLNNINLNNINLGINGQASGGTFANLSMNNDQIPSLSGIPYDTWNFGFASGTDPNIPNALLMSVTTNDPVIPRVDTIVMTPSGGGTNGNGSFVLTGGDLSVGGDAILQNLVSATSLATDANGKIIAGSGGSSAYSWNLGNAIFTDNTFGDTTPTSQSYAVIDSDSRIVTIFLNVALTSVGSYTNQTPRFNIDTNVSWTPTATGTIPPPTALFQSLLPVNNTITTFAGINLTNISTTPNFTPLCDNFYMSAYFVSAGLMSVTGLQTVSATNGQRVIYSGVMQYPY